MGKRNKHEYVVGYKGDLECIYGRKGNELGGLNNIDKLTERQARSALKNHLCSPDHNATLYKLVPVEIKTVREWKNEKV